MEWIMILGSSAIAIGIIAVVIIALGFKSQDGANE